MKRKMRSPLPAFSKECSVLRGIIMHVSGPARRSSPPTLARIRPFMTK